MTCGEYSKLVDIYTRATAWGKIRIWAKTQQVYIWQKIR